MSLLIAAMEIAGVLVSADKDAVFDPNTVTPGVGGFLAAGFVAVAVILLGFDLVRRLRRSRYRSEIREELEAELAERNSETGDGVAEPRG